MDFDLIETDTHLLLSICYLIISKITQDNDFDPFYSTIKILSNFMVTFNKKGKSLNIKEKMLFDAIRKTILHAICYIFNPLNANCII